VTSHPPPPRARTLAGAASVVLVLVLTAAVAVVAVRGGGAAATPPTSAGPAVPLSQESPPSVPTAGAVRPAGGGTARAATRLSTFWGVDVSWPQCRAPLPRLATAFVVVGVNDGTPFTTNPCLAGEVSYAKSHSGYAAYLNIDAPRAGDPASYGRRAALDGLARATAAGLRPPVVWLDIETLNHWADPATNVAVIGAAMTALRARHVSVGIYSSAPMWQQVTGGADPNAPVWLATSVTDYRQIDSLCAAGMGGEAAVIGQYVATTGSRLIDVDVLCSATRSSTVPMFAAGRG
jgi:hypothetical protein